MFARICAALCVAASLTLLVSVAQAQEKTHQGKIVSAADGKLVMTDAAGKGEHTHMIPATAKITVDGKAAALADLKKGDAVTVTQDAAGKVVSVAVKHAAG
jgi:hypothetical protein